MGKIIRNGVEYSGAVEAATAVNYDSSVSGLNAQTVQEAIDEVQGNIDTLNESLTTNVVALESLVPLEAGGGFLLRKYGKIVMLTNNGNTFKTAEASAVASPTVMCVIPEGYRPTTGINVRSYHTKGGKVYPMNVGISNNGNVTFNPFDNESNSLGTSLYWTGCITWIID